MPNTTHRHRAIERNLTTARALRSAFIADFAATAIRSVRRALSGRQRALSSLLKALRPGAISFQRGRPAEHCC